MIVKLLKPWNNWKPGMVFATMQENVAEVLIHRGVGVQIPHISEDNEVQSVVEVVLTSDDQDGNVSTTLVTDRGNHKRRRR